MLTDYCGIGQTPRGGCTVEYILAAWLCKKPSIVITDLYCLWTLLDCAGTRPAFNDGLSWSPTLGPFFGGPSPCARRNHANKSRNGSGLRAAVLPEANLEGADLTEAYLGTANLGWRSSSQPGTSRGVGVCRARCDGGWHMHRRRDTPLVTG
jgi:hypothetical protein